MKSFSKKEIHYSLYGNILGDGYIRKNKTTQSWIECCHTNKQREYVEWLENLYISWGLQTTTRYDWTRETNYGSYTYSQVSCKLQTDRHINHNRIFDNNNEIIFSDYVSNRITIFGLLLWYLDDGSLSIHTKKNGSISRSAKLCTHRFNNQSQIKIQKMFLGRFNIEVKIHKDKSFEFIYFNAINFRKFFDLVRPYLKNIPKSMYYKFNMQYVENNVLNSKELLKYNLPDLADII